MIEPLPDRPCVHLDRGYDARKTRDLLEILGYDDQIAVKGIPAPIQVGKCWPVERTHSWMNGYGKLRRLTGQRKIIAEFYLYLADRHTPTHHASPHPLPLANKARHPPAPLTIICRSLLRDGAYRGGVAQAPVAVPRVVRAGRRHGRRPCKGSTGRGKWD